MCYLAPTLGRENHYASVCARSDPAWLDGSRRSAPVSHGPVAILRARTGALCDGRGHHERDGRDDGRERRRTRRDDGDDEQRPAEGGAHARTASRRQHHRAQARSAPCDAQGRRARCFGQAAATDPRRGQRRGRFRAAERPSAAVLGLRRARTQGPAGGNRLRQTRRGPDPSGPVHGRGRSARGLEGEPRQQPHLHHMAQ